MTFGPHHKAEWGHKFDMQVYILITLNIYRRITEVMFFLMLHITINDCDLFVNMHAYFEIRMYTFYAFVDRHVHTSYNLPMLVDFNRYQID